MTGAVRQLRLVWRSAALEPDSGLAWRAKLAAAVYCEFANQLGVMDPAPSAATVAAWMGVPNGRPVMRFAIWRQQAG
jgi:hypothetical protein